MNATISFMNQFLPIGFLLLLLLFYFALKGGKKITHIYIYIMYIALYVYVGIFTYIIQSKTHLLLMYIKPRKFWIEKLVM